MRLSSFCYLLSLIMMAMLMPDVASAGIVNNGSSIAVKHSGKCLTVLGASTADGAAITQSNCGGTSNEQWTLVPVQDAYQVVVKNSGKCLDVYAGQTTDGASIIQWSCHTGNNQLWYARPRGDYFQRSIWVSGS